MYVYVYVCAACDSPLYDLKDDPIWFDCMRKVDLHKLHGWSFSSVYMQGSSWDSTTSFQTTIQHYCVYVRVINLIMRFYNQFQPFICKGHSTTMQFPNNWTMHRNFSQIPFLSLNFHLILYKLVPLKNCYNIGLAEKSTKKYRNRRLRRGENRILNLHHNIINSYSVDNTCMHSHHYTIHYNATMLVDFLCLKMCSLWSTYISNQFKRIIIYLQTLAIVIIILSLNAFF